ncbi:hypothetical protein CspHIS471_0407760 [Cutaneotrichosporon sp. HIS471]|nr:hypothetical protein CspHIS471_0407760 [Cutaneotrichosporon sp. HIS471]
MSTNVDDLPIPGSLLLVEEGDHEIVLHPTPSNDVNDPLNWSWKRKQLAFWMLMAYTWLWGFGACSVYSVLIPLSEVKGISLAALNAGTGYMFLLLGFGGLVTQPLALTFGKRPMFLVSSIALLGMLVWQVYITNEGTWYANKIIQGFFGAPIEMLVEVGITDLFYAHERGFYMGVYTVCLTASNYLAPVWAGYANDNLGWEWVFWISAMIAGLLVILLFFFMEETNYNRGTSELSEKYDAAAVAVANDAESRHSDKDKDGETTVNVTVANDGQRTLVGNEWSYTKKIALYRERYASNKTMFAMAYRPFLYFRYPVVVWSGLLYGSSLVWYNVLNATASMLWTQNYGFSASKVGLSYLAPTLGAILAIGYCGFADHKFLLWQTKRKNGIREPEDRLWLLVLMALLMPTALILWGVGAARHIHWFGLIVGSFLIGFCNPPMGSIPINYTTDSYKDLSGEALLTVMIIRNSLSFGIGYAITPWLNIGLQNTFITAAFACMAVILSFLIMVKWGKTFRKRSRKSYWKYVESSVMPHH